MLYEKEILKFLKRLCSTAAAWRGFMRRFGIRFKKTLCFTLILMRDYQYTTMCVKNKIAGNYFIKSTYAHIVEKSV